MSATTNCYTGICPECKGVVAVTVADVNDIKCMDRAMKNVREFRRYGLEIGQCTVADVREGRIGLEQLRASR